MKFRFARLILPVGFLFLGFVSVFGASDPLAEARKLFISKCNSDAAQERLEAAETLSLANEAFIDGIVFEHTTRLLEEKDARVVDAVLSGIDQQLGGFVRVARGSEKDFESMSGKLVAIIDSLKHPAQTRRDALYVRTMFLYQILPSERYLDEEKRILRRSLLHLEKGGEEDLQWAIQYASLIRTKEHETAKAIVYCETLRSASDAVWLSFFQKMGEASYFPINKGRRVRHARFYQVLKELAPVLEARIAADRELFTRHEGARILQQLKLVDNLRVEGGYAELKRIEGEALGMSFPQREKE